MLQQQTPSVLNTSHSSLNACLIMYLSLLLLVGSTVCVGTRISEPNLEAVNFAHPIEGRRLSGSVLEELEVDSDDSCRFKCVNETRCFSYNIGSANSTKNNSKRFKCQLSDSDRFASFTNFTKDKDFKYGGFQVITKKKSKSVVKNIFKVTQIFKVIKFLL